MIFDIQKYSIHDGPGIRTVVFLKGCPLRCMWCANPESWLVKPQLFYVKSRCVGCGNCREAAPEGVVNWADDNRPEFEFRKANEKDLSWVSACLTGALQVKGEEQTLANIISTVMQDEIFYRQSGGGITLSGGEPLMQPDLALPLLQTFRDYNLHTAIETTGYVPYELLLQVMPLVNLFLYDFKVLDNDKHLKFTGVSNSKILRNLEKILKAGANVIVRMPVIPAVNDDPEQMLKTVQYLKRIGATRFALLPFHQLGRGKYISIGQSYQLSSLTSPNDKQLEELRKIISDAGLSDQYE